MPLLSFFMGQVFVRKLHLTKKGILEKSTIFCNKTRFSRRSLFLILSKSNAVPAKCEIITAKEDGQLAKRARI